MRSTAAVSRDRSRSPYSSPSIPRSPIDSQPMKRRTTNPVKTALPERRGGNLAAHSAMSSSGGQEGGKEEQMLDLEELEQFAKAFKQRRIKLGKS